ncbi:MAG: hypothetical protein V9E82_03075 [Candidatus Nanopelagicales bacterium]
MLISEQDADQLVKLVARRTAAQIRRYDSRDAALGAAPPITSIRECRQMQYLPWRPFWPTERWKQRRIPTRLSRLTRLRHAAPAHRQAETASPDPLAVINELKQQQAALQEELAAKDKALLRLKQQAQASDAQGIDASSSNIYS